MAETSASSTVIHWTMIALGKVIRPAGQGLLLSPEHKVWLLQALSLVQVGPCLHHPPPAGRPTHFSSPHFNSLTSPTTACFNVLHRATPQLPPRTAPPVIALQNGLVSWGKVGQTEVNPYRVKSGETGLSVSLCRVRTRPCSVPWNCPLRRLNPRSQGTYSE